MSKFKIQVGDYVATKSMGEQERIEIVSMLMKAGASKGEGFLHANLYWNYIGVNRGGVFYFDTLASFAEDCGRTRKITIDQLRDAAGESEEKPSAWDGEGLPPVGTVCEATWGGKAFWRKAVILPNSHIAVDHLSDGWGVRHIYEYCGSASFEFRPVQSEEQKQVAEIDAIIANYTSESGLELAQEIYNAGFRKEMKDE